MQKHRFPFIEDYLEYLAGYKSLSATPVSLARYDVQIVSSMASQTSGGLSLSDRQAELAHKLVVKYRKQLSNQGIDVEDQLVNPKFRLAIRQVDRSKTITTQDKKAIIRFPYDTKIIDVLREDGKKIPGELKFNKQERRWEAEINEPRITWLCGFADKYQFDVDQTLKEIKDQIDQCRLESFAIELKVVDDQLTIVNAESSLIEYINTQLNGFDRANILQLIDQSSTLGYSVDQDLLDSQGIDSALVPLFLRRENHLPFNQPGNLENILKYAEITQRYPIFVYDPFNDNVSDNVVLEKFQNYFGSEIEIASNRQRKFNLEGKRCVYMTNWPSNQDIQIPLLLTMNAMMVGPKKQHLVQNSEKVVFCTEFFYNS